MKWFLLLCVLPRVVFSCSCIQGSFNRPRAQAIRDDYCSARTIDVYVATIVGATCNCVPASGDANLYCQDYTYATGDTSVVNVGVVRRASWREIACSLPQVIEVDTCLESVALLTRTGTRVQNATSNLPPVDVFQTTDRRGFCLLSCPFNNMSSSEYIRPVFGSFQLCIYTVEVMMVFKGNLTVGETLVVLGPEPRSFVSSCGNPGRVLQLGEQYVVGLGGACNPINEWSTMSSYSSRELKLLSTNPETMLCGALAFVPSLTPLFLLTILNALLV